MRRDSGELQPGEGRSLARLTPAAVIVTGPPAAGKTTLATALARALHYAIMDLDTVTGPLTRAALRLSTGDETAIDSPAGSTLRAARYETLLDVAAANLDVGVGVVIATPFTAERSSPEDFAWVRRRLRGDDHVAIVYIDTPEQIVRGRLASRNAPRDRGEKSVADQVAQVLEALERNSRGASC